MSVRLTLSVVLVVGLLVGQLAAPAAADGSVWTDAGSSATEASFWSSVAYGNGVWVAVSFDGTNRAMRSTDGGVTWTAPAVAPEQNQWMSVAYGNGVWVAVAQSGTSRVMRSEDGGATWTAVGTAAGVEANGWRSVAYGNGVWVAVANSGTNRVMRSTNGGATWTAVGTVAGVEANGWRSVAYGNPDPVAFPAGVWVAVAHGDAAVMRSTDGGESWTALAGLPNDPDNFAYRYTAVAYGNGVWVATTRGGTDRFLRSTDGGATWTEVTVPVRNNEWQSVAYGDGVWIALGADGFGGGKKVVVRSTNGGATWTAVPESAICASTITWYSVAFGTDGTAGPGNGVWVAVGEPGSLQNRVMRSTAGTTCGSSGPGGPGPGSDAGSGAVVLTPVLSGGIAPTVPAGQGVWRSADGSEVPLEVTSPGTGQVRYEGDGLSVTLTGASGTSSSGGLVVAPDGEIVCEVCLDLATGNVIETWLFSQPRLVAAHRVDVEPCQTFSIPVGAPLDGLGAIEVGAHTLQLALPTGSGMQAVNIGVTIGGPVPGGIPAGQGPAPVWPIVLAALMGIALMRWGARAEV